jgi:drug/metabolite transporter (DMT)-like permease
VDSRPPLKSIAVALSTPFFLGVAPIFGKMAITGGVDAFTVAAVRTLVSVALLWMFYLLFFRKYIYIYPAGLLGCVVIGVVNGIGSLFYYSGLQSLDNASLAQLLNGMYLVFAVIISRLVDQKADSRTLLRVALTLAALVMVTGFGEGPANWVGVGLMLANALMFAGTMMLAQYVLYEMPSRTATLYILSTMGLVVTMVWIAAGEMPEVSVWQSALPPIVMLGITTALSRLAMFAGVKLFGMMQTAIFAVMEIGVALVLAFVLLNERLSGGQIVGVALLLFSLLLIRQRDLLPRGYNPNALVVANMASVQFQRIAFHRAFGTQELDNEEETMTNLTTQEIIAIQRMMGARTGAIDPFPISESKRLTKAKNDA